VRSKSLFITVNLPNFYPVKSLYFGIYNSPYD
jgi:hypothetical protein